jgi:hypothetical protein
VQEHNHVVASVDELLCLWAALSPCLQILRLERLVDLGLTAGYLALLKPADSAVELDRWIEQPCCLFPVPSQPRLGGLPHHFHVLLRHRPGSISRCIRLPFFVGYRSSSIAVVEGTPPARCLVPRSGSDGCCCRHLHRRFRDRAALTPPARARRSADGRRDADPGPCVLLWLVHDRVGVNWLEPDRLPVRVRLAASAFTCREQRWGAAQPVAACHAKAVLRARSSTGHRTRWAARSGASSSRILATSSAASRAAKWPVSRSSMGRAPGTASMLARRSEGRDQSPSP